MWVGHCCPQNYYLLDDDFSFPRYFACEWRYLPDEQPSGVKLETKHKILDSLLAFRQQKNPPAPNRARRDNGRVLQMRCCVVATPSPLPLHVDTCPPGGGQRSPGQSPIAPRPIRKPENKLVREISFSALIESL